MSRSKEHIMFACVAYVPWYEPDYVVIVHVSQPEPDHESFFVSDLFSVDFSSGVFVLSVLLPVDLSVEASSE